MNKKIILTLLIIVVCVNSIFSISPSFYLSGGYLYSYDTNVFSYPMIKNATPTWLKWRSENPYEERVNNGFHLESDVFFSPKGRTGLSFSLDTGWAYKDNQYVPEGNFLEKWDYRKYDGMPFVKPRLFAGIGPSFRSVHGNIDFGVSIRASLGTYDYTVPDLVLGIIVEPYINAFVVDNVFLTVGLHYDAHLMSFHLASDSEIFNKDYVMITLGGYIGMGIFVGER